MIRTPEFTLSPEVKEAWAAAIEPVAEAALADFRTWPLFQQVGEPWPDAPPRFVRVPSLERVVKGLKATRTQELEEAANPGLKAMDRNASTLLNLRKQHFQNEWSRVQEVIWRETEAALKAMSKRLKWKPAKGEEGFWLYSPNTRVWQHVWDQLHPEAVEAPFHEHVLTILRAGHFAAGVQGDDWKTCQFLYF